MTKRLLTRLTDWDSSVDSMAAVLWPLIIPVLAFLTFIKSAVWVGNKIMDWLIKKWG